MAREENGTDDCDLKRVKICYAASSGGHLEEILGLAPMKDRYDSFLITEKTKYKPDVWQKNVYMVPAVNRRDSFLFFKLIAIVCAGFYIFLKEKPDVVISTGALMTLPICVSAKLMGKKLIFIESIARVHTGSATGRFLYRYVDLFIIQWESLRPIYPNAVYKGRLI